MNISLEQAIQCYPFGVNEDGPVSRKAGYADDKGCKSGVGIGDSPLTRLPILDIGRPGFDSRSGHSSLPSSRTKALTNTCAEWVYEQLYHVKAK